MPPRSRKRDTFAAAVPATQDAITYLREQGQTGMADAVQTTLNFATETADLADRKADRDADKRYGNRSVFVEKTYLDYVRSAAKAAEPPVDLTKLVKDRLTQFVKGEWTPDLPPRPKPGEVPWESRAAFNLRVSDDLWNQVRSKVEDLPLPSGWRGHKPSARQVVTAALLEAFPALEETPAAKKAATQRR